jgi:hypothetical protein
MHRPKVPSIPFCQTGCGIFSWDIHYPIFYLWTDFFSFHISDQRKEAKERRLVDSGTFYSFVNLMIT